MCLRNYKFIVIFSLFFLFFLNSFVYADDMNNHLILNMDFNQIVDLTGNNNVSLEGSDYRIENGICGEDNFCYNVGYANNGINLGSPLFANNSSWTASFDAYIPFSSQGKYVSFLSEYSVGVAGRFFAGKNMSTEKEAIRIDSELSTNSSDFGLYDSWNHWVVSKSGNNLILTINGVEKINHNFSYNITDQYNAILGLNETPVGISYIDDFYLFDLNYSYNDVDSFLTNYSSDFNLPDENISDENHIISEDLILKMNFDEIVDLTGNNNVYLEGIDYTVDGGVCEFGKCYDIGHKDNGINLGSAILSNNSSWTVGFDAYIPVGSDYFVSFISQYGSGIIDRFYIGKHNDNKTTIKLGANQYQASNLFSNWDLWQRWVISKKDNNYILTIDGVEKINTLISGTLMNTNTMVGIVDTDLSPGYIDNLFIFDSNYCFEDVNNFMNSNISQIESINITKPSNYRIYQRNDSNYATINLVGSISNNSELEDIELKINDGNWNTILENVNSNFSYDFDLNVGMVDLKVRIKDTNVSETIEFGVGDIYLLIGQSNQDGRTPIKHDFEPTNGVYGYMFQQTNRETYYITSNEVSGSWKINNDSTGNGNAGGSYNYGSQWPIVATSLVNSYEIPIGWITGTYGGTSISLWQKGAVHYDRALELLSQATDSENEIKGILFHQGESDSSKSKEWYYSYLKSMVNSLEQDINFDKILVGIVSRPDSSFGGGLAGGVQEAQHQLINDYDDVFLGPESYDISLSVDNLHYKTEDEINEFARRWYLHIAKEFYDDSISYPTLERYYKYDSNTIGIISNNELYVSNFLFEESNDCSGFEIYNHGSLVNDYNVSFGYDSDLNKNLVLIDIFEDVDKDDFDLNYANTNTGFNKYVLRSLDNNLSVTRVYYLDKINQYNLNYTSDENGFLEGTVSSLVKENENGSIIRAIPNRGYSFESWSDGVLENPRRDLNIFEDINVSAIYSANDLDDDNIMDYEDNFIGDSNIVNHSGFDNLNVFVDDNSDIDINFTGHKNIKLKDNNFTFLEFDNNFSEKQLDFSKISVEKGDNYLIVDLNSQIQNDQNKTLYIEDNGFISLCVKNETITSISEITSNCTGSNEFDFTSCLGGSYTHANGISCVDYGDYIEVSNLTHSGILGTLPVINSSEGSSLNYTYYVTDKYNLDVLNLDELYINEDVDYNIFSKDNDILEEVDFRVLFNNDVIFEEVLYLKDSYFLKSLNFDKEGIYRFEVRERDHYIEIKTFNLISRSIEENGINISDDLNNQTNTDYSYNTADNIDSNITSNNYNLNNTVENSIDDSSTKNRFVILKISLIVLVILFLIFFIILRNSKKKLF